MPTAMAGILEILFGKIEGRLAQVDIEDGKRQRSRQLTEQAAHKPHVTDSLPSSAAQVGTIVIPSDGAALNV
jgi:hypothetical protein